MVEQNHVSRLQRAHGAQRQQFRIARSGADQDDGAGLGRTIRPKQSIELGLGRDSVGRGDSAVGEFLPEMSPATE